MFIPTHDWQIMLHRQCSDPRIIRGNRTAFLPERCSQRCVGQGSFGGDREQIEIAEMLVQPRFVCSPMSRAGDAVAELTKNQHWDCHSRLSTQDCTQRFVAVNERR